MLRRANAVAALLAHSIFMMTCAATAGEPPALPDTPHGTCVRGYLDSFNSGDAERVRAFELAIRAESSLKARSMEDRLSQYRELHQRWRSLTLKQVVRDEAAVLTVLVENGNDEVFQFGFEFEPQPPGKLVAIRIEGPIADAAAGAEPLTAQQRQQAIEELIRNLNDAYVFPQKAAAMEKMLRDHLAAKRYDDCDSAAKFAERMSEDLQAVCHDKHLRMRAGAATPMALRQLSPEEGARSNYGFVRAEILPGNVGYLKLNMFHPSADAQKTAAAALEFLKSCDALIFDLRENGGGSPEMIRFISSYLFDKPTHLNSFYDRAANRTSETWTLENVPGQRFRSDLPVYVLISNYTFSGAEEFTYNLRCLDRATIVGETSGGGAHPVQPRVLAARFTVMIPFARAENPITKSNWEGVGVEPHIKVPASQALEAAQEDVAKRLSKLVETTGQTQTP